jgi:hypothetical protein
MKKSFFLVIFFITVILFNCNNASGQPDSAKRARELLTQSMKARDQKNIGLARAYFLQAKKLHSSLPVPVWIKQDFSVPENEIEELELFARLTHSLSYAEKKQLYSERIALSPGNKMLRSKFLEFARQNSDTQAMQRHSSALKSNSNTWETAKIVITWIIFLLILYNAWKIISDLRSKKTPAAKR